MARRWADALPLPQAHGHPGRTVRPLRHAARRTQALFSGSKCDGRRIRRPPSTGRPHRGGVGGARGNPESPSAGAAPLAGGPNHVPEDRLLRHAMRRADGTPLPARQLRPLFPRPEETYHRPGQQWPGARRAAGPHVRRPGRQHLRRRPTRLQGRNREMAAGNRKDRRSVHAPPHRPGRDRRHGPFRDQRVEAAIRPAERSGHSARGYGLEAETPPAAQREGSRPGDSVLEHPKLAWGNGQRGPADLRRGGPAYLTTAALQDTPYTLLLTTTA